MKNLHTIAFVLLIIGGLNWGLEVFGFGVERFVGSSIANIIYILVALSALYEAFTHKESCKHCEAAPTKPMGMGQM
jgi:uncharacterized membrane protein YuzA (DUF378 family)